MNTQNKYPWGNNRRYNAYSDWFTARFGRRVQKVSINAGFTCPNRDGTRGEGGCTYCNNQAFSPSYCRPESSVTDQILRGIDFHRQRYRRTYEYLAYFQAYSNTYSGLDNLRSLYSEALAIPSVVGLVIGTRPDCVSDELLDWLKELSRDHFIMVEYGIESVYDKTLQRINRGHDFDTAVQAVKNTSGRGILTGAHFIFGLPGESREQVIESASVISGLPLDSIKIHQLQLIKGTVMTAEYAMHPDHFDLYSLDEYLGLVAEFTARLNPLIMIDRISGEAPPRMLDDPRNWNIRSGEILKMFGDRLEELDLWQGRYYNNK